jgi:hypothetical protein
MRHGDDDINIFPGVIDTTDNFFLVTILMRWRGAHMSGSMMPDFGQEVPNYGQ